MRAYWENVIPFAHEMVRKLRDNDHKTGWEDCPIDELLDHLREEVLEIDKIIKNTMVKPYPQTADSLRDPIKRMLISECADVANMAMMIADNVKNEITDEF